MPHCLSDVFSSRLLLVDPLTVGTPRLERDAETGSDRRTRHQHANDVTARVECVLTGMGQVAAPL